MIMTEQRLVSALTSLQGTLFSTDNTGYNLFSSVVMQRFKCGHAAVNYEATTGKDVEMDLGCSRCCRYIGVEFNPEWDTPTELQAAKEVWRSFISGCADKN